MEEELSDAGSSCQLGHIVYCVPVLGSLLWSSDRRRSLLQCVTVHCLNAATVHCLHNRHSSTEQTNEQTVRKLQEREGLNQLVVSYISALILPTIHRELLLPRYQLRV